jgi:hypothetical protein
VAKKEQELLLLAGRIFIKRIIHLITVTIINMNRKNDWCVYQVWEMRVRGLFEFNHTHSLKYGLHCV